ncbi:MAG TPA: hypothetical protein V6D12_13125 [Candidatus Obscuribacterales bacterium]
MNFSDYLEETSGHFGWDHKEDFTSWAARMRQFKDELRSTRLDNLSHTVRNSLEVESSKQGVGQEQRKAERTASLIARQASEINQARTIASTRRVISSPNQD